MKTLVLWSNIKAQAVPAQRVQQQFKEGEGEMSAQPEKISTQPTWNTCEAALRPFRDLNSFSSTNDVRRQLWQKRADLLSMLLHLVPKMFFFFFFFVAADWGKVNSEAVTRSLRCMQTTCCVWWSYDWDMQEMHLSTAACETCCRPWTSLTIFEMKGDFSLLELQFSYYNLTINNILNTDKFSSPSRVRLLYSRHGFVVLAVLFLVVYWVPAQLRGHFTTQWKVKSQFTHGNLTEVGNNKQKSKVI